MSYPKNTLKCDLNLNKDVLGVDPVDQIKMFQQLFAQSETWEFIKENHGITLSIQNPMMYNDVVKTGMFLAPYSVGEAAQAFRHYWNRDFWAGKTVDGYIVPHINTAKSFQLRPVQDSARTVYPNSFERLTMDALRYATIRHVSAMSQQTQIDYCKSVVDMLPKMDGEMKEEIHNQIDRYYESKRLK